MDENNVGAGFYRVRVVSAPMPRMPPVMRAVRLWRPKRESRKDGIWMGRGGRMEKESIYRGTNILRQY